MDSGDEIEFTFDNLPGCDELIKILVKETACLSTWIEIADAYWKQNRIDEFVKLLETSQNVEFTKKDKENGLQVLDMLGAYYVQESKKEKDKEKRKEMLKKARDLYIKGDKLNRNDLNHLIGKAYLCLAEGDQQEHAEELFDFVLNRTDNFVPAMIGKAYLLFNRKDYRGALGLFKTVLRFCPNCSPNIRLYLGYCFLKTNNQEKAIMAFERVLELDKTSVNALTALAILKLNELKPSSTKIAVTTLFRAYEIDNNHPVVANHLSNHFFYKADYEKALKLALQAKDNSKNDAIRAESYYHLGRIFHSKNDYNSAFKFYQQSIKLASPNFILPYYRLGQIYYYRRDLENAILSFEKILKVYPDDYDSMKMLSSLYINSDKFQSKKSLVKNYLQKYLYKHQDDIEAWIEFAQILEESDVNNALDAYKNVIEILNEMSAVIPPEILNNRGVLFYRMEKFKSAEDNFLKSFELTQSYAENNPKYYNSIAVTIVYNLARLYEICRLYSKAEIFYHKIISAVDTYVDAYLRLGCIAKNKGLIDDAFDWFNQAFIIDKKNVNTCLLLGNLYLSQLKYEPAIKLFEQVKEQSKDDSYSVIGIGNVLLHKRYINDDSEMCKILGSKYKDPAIDNYTLVLEADSKNIWAANGVGAVLAHKGCIDDALNIFSSVYEATSDFSDVQLNLAHIYVEKNLLSEAIEMYERCIRKFNKHYDVENLQYLARAYCKADRLAEAKKTLLKARRIAPDDMILLFNTALVCQQHSEQVMNFKKSTLADVYKAKDGLNLSAKYFQYLTVNIEPLSHLAELEIKKCQVLLRESQDNIERARKVDEEDEKLRKKQHDEVEVFRLQKLKEKHELEEQERQKKEMVSKQRIELMEKAKNILETCEKDQSVDADDETKVKKRNRTDEDKVENDKKKQRTDQGNSDVKTSAVSGAN